MKPREIPRADVPALVDAYRDAAAGHGRSTAEGDYKTGNRRADELLKINQELRARGPEVHEALLSLLDDADPNVRLWAASHALQFAPHRGEAVLEALAPESGFVGLDAQTTLDEWRSGRLSFP